MSVAKGYCTISYVVFDSFLNTVPYWDLLSSMIRMIAVRRCTTCSPRAPDTLCFTFPCFLLSRPLFYHLPSMWTDPSEDEQTPHEVTSRKRSSRGKLKSSTFPEVARPIIVSFFQRVINVGKLKANANDRPQRGTQRNVKAVRLPELVRDFKEKVAVSCIIRY